MLMNMQGQNMMMMPNNNQPQDKPRKQNTPGEGEENNGNE